MNTSAASIVMTTMYAARLACFELLRAVGGLSQFLTKWGDVEDKKLLQNEDNLTSACNVCPH